MQYIDEFILELKKKQMVSDFINSTNVINIHNEECIYSIEKNIKKNNKRLDYINSLLFDHNDSYEKEDTKKKDREKEKDSLLKNNKKFIESLNEIEYKIKETMQEIKKDNECPICLNDMGKTNYLVPKCGHKLCMHCFVSNVVYTKRGHICCLCRDIIVPTV
jgi:chromosome segregation ATPase